MTRHWGLGQQDSTGYRRPYPAWLARTSTLERIASSGTRSEPDSVSVTVPADTLNHEFYMFAHDTVGPGLSDVTSDRLDATPVCGSTVLCSRRPGVRGRGSSAGTATTATDSVPVTILRVSSAARFDRARAGQRRKLFVVDSTMRADGRRAAGTAKARSAEGVQSAKDSDF